MIHVLRIPNFELALRRAMQWTAASLAHPTRVLSACARGQKRHRRHTAASSLRTHPVAQPLVVSPPLR